jgi:hypothetical protein
VRRLHRPEVKLPTLITGAGARKAAKHLADWSDDPTTDFDFPPHWNEPDVRGALYAMHGGACAFCLSELKRGDRGDVEHFRPKSLYFWLAYAFDNYLLGCSQCNRVYKRDDFPLALGASRVEYEDRGLTEKEERLFLDPVLDPVEDWLVLEVGDWSCWRVAPVLPPTSLEYARVTATSVRFHWNDDPQLVKSRTDAIDEMLYAIEKEDFDDARRCASRFRPHGGAVRNLLRLEKVVPLPTADEEVAWLLEDLWQDWQWAQRIGGGLCEKRQEEIEWTFAVLWKAPPPGVSIDIGAWLADSGLKMQVESKHRLL